jgi:HD-GYP domain-containing protein (c-di-GMP phosphodiesterase class II)
LGDDEAVTITYDRDAQMKKHTVLGYELVDTIPQLSKAIKEAVLFHHERGDGSGYPYGFSGKYIDFYTKIVSVADVYDAMTQNRVYKKKATPFDAFQMFLTSGQQVFERQIVDIFLKNIAAFYVGVGVELSNGLNGEIAYVPPKDIVNPVVNVNELYIDLAEESSLRITGLV